MEKEIIGIDVSIQFSDGETAKGHISPIGTHIDKRISTERIRPYLLKMRAAIEEALKPYKGQNVDGTRTR